MRSTTRSICGALRSIPATHQYRPRTNAAATTADWGAAPPKLVLLTRGGTKLGEIVLQEAYLAAVLREVTGFERCLRRVVVVGCGLHELRDGLCGPG